MSKYCEQNQLVSRNREQIWLSMSKDRKELEFFLKIFFIGTRQDTSYMMRRSANQHIIFDVLRAKNSDFEGFVAKLRSKLLHHVKLG